MIVLLLALAAADEPKVELGLGGELVAATTAYTYGAFAGAGVGATARVFAGNVFVASTTDFGVMPRFAPDGATSGLDSAWFIREWLHAGYRFYVNDVWQLALAGGVAPSFFFEINGDSGGGNLFVSGAAGIPVRAKVAPGFLVEAAPMLSIALGENFLLQPGVTVWAIWCLDD